MKLARITAGLLAIGVAVSASSPTRAEEITLKDGQKIVGTIVGYEKDMFRVETDYGIALIRKDKVASILVTKPGSAAASPQAPLPPTRKTIDVKPAHVAAPLEVTPPAPQTIPTPPKSPAPVASAPRTPMLVPVKAPPPEPVAAKPASQETAAKPPAQPPVSHPLDVPLPARLQEHLQGNTYTSDTFQFSMFKPPDWKIYEGVPKETGSGIMAMGTEDEQTLLIVDRQVWSGAPNLTSDLVEAKLRQTYQEYHRTSEEALECDGQTAVRRTFTGILEGVEWHGVAVHVIHGNMVFGITGLTSAETFQFQEAIFNKIVRTLHFINPPTPATASALP
jgi:hypothetical protein